MKESSNSTVEIIPKISVQLQKYIYRVYILILTMSAVSPVVTLIACSPERHDVYFGNHMIGIIETLYKETRINHIVEN